MAKTYYLQFGGGNPSTYTGLLPTFTVFSYQGLTSLSAPGITEAPSGSGLYQFIYFPTLPVVFVADGGSGLGTSDRYVTGTLDPVQAVDEQIGNVASSIGSTAIDPSTVFGLVRRAFEFMEGNATYAKSTGLWSIFTRGSSTLLRVKTLSNNSTEADKS